MRLSIPTLFALVAATAAAAPPQADTARMLHLQWRDLDGLTRNRRFSVVLSSGANVSGQVLSVQPDAIVLEGRKGHIQVPREQVKRLRLYKAHGYRRWMGLGIGAGAGTAIAWPVATYMSNEGNRALIIPLAIVAVPAGLGYLAGWGADRGSKEYMVDPDPPAAPPPTRSQLGIMSQLRTGE